MARSRNIQYTLCREIEARWKEGRGTSKRAARARATAAAGERTTSPLVHSDVTKDNYIRACKQFAGWIKTEHPEAYKSTDAAKAFVGDYLKGIGNPGTRMAAAAGLAKAYGLSGGAAWGVDLGKRPLSKIQRGRNISARQAAWRSNHAGVAEALRSCGLRRSEAAALRGRDVYQRPDGSWCARVIRGKGGLRREATIWSTPTDTRGLDWLREAAQAAGDNGFVFGSVNDLQNANIHALRAEYAGRMYDAYMQDGHTASGQTYTPRDGSGSNWDKGCLSAVNHDLGHGDDRCSTAYYNYLSYGHG